MADKDIFGFSGVKPYKPTEDSFGFSGVKPYKPEVLDSTEGMPWHEAADVSYSTYLKERDKFLDELKDARRLIKDEVMDHDSPFVKKVKDKVEKILELDRKWESKNKQERPEWYRQEEIAQKLEEGKEAAATRPDMSALSPTPAGRVRELFTPVFGPSPRQTKQAQWVKGDKPVKEKGWIEGFDLQQRGLIPSLIAKEGAEHAGFLDFPSFSEEARHTILGDSKWAKRGAGVVNAVTSMVESVVSPLGVATLGGAGLLPKAGKSIHAFFAADMTRAVVEHSPEVYELWKDPDATEQEKWEALSGQVLLATFAALSAKGVVSEKGIITEAAKSPAKAIEFTKGLGIYDHFARMAKRPESRGGKLETGRAKGEVLEKMEGETQAEFNKKVEEQRILEGIDSPVETPAEALKIKDIPLVEKPVAPEAVAAPDPIIRPDAPLKDREMAKDREIALDREMAKDREMVDADKLAEFRAELEAKGELGKGPEPLPETLPAPEIKPVPKADPLDSMTVKQLKAEAAKEEISLKGKKKKADIIAAIREWRAGKEKPTTITEPKSELPPDWQGRISPPEEIARQMREQQKIEDAAALEASREFLKGEEAVKPPIRDTVSRGAREVAEGFREQALSKFRPLERLEEMVLEKSGTERPAQDVAARFETLAGSSGKAELATRKFDRDIYDGIDSLAKSKSKDSSKVNADFNLYLFLKRTKNRLESDSKKKKVGNLTLDGVRGQLKALESEVGSDVMQGFGKLGAEFQKHADISLRLQVESGRMSKELYDLIKSENEFYAPFILRELGGWVDPKTGVETARNPLIDKAINKKAALDSVREIAKKIEGISSKDIKLKSLTDSMRSQLWQSVILAERNKAMLRLKEIAELDVDPKTGKIVGEFIKQLKKNEMPREGYGTVNVLHNGKKLRYELPSNSADVIKGLGTSPKGIVWSFLRGGAIPFKYGATTANIPFQFKNLFFADLPSAALMSKYGLGMNYKGKRSAGQVLASIKDIGPFLFGDAGYLKSLYSAISQGEGRMARKFDAQKLYEDAMDANVMRSTSQQQIIDPHSAFEYKLPNSDPRVLDSIGKITNMIEESFKIHGIQRALKLHGAKNVKELLERNPEAITEVRRYYGSPDFARFGKAMEHMNILYMFSNARMQGASRSVNRFAANTPEGKAARANLMTAVGVPAVMLYLHNLKNWEDELKDVPEYDKRNNFIVFLPWKIKRKLRSGEVIEGQDYLKIPKREDVKYISNAIENGLDFLRYKDPESITKIAAETIEDLSPTQLSLWGIVPSHPFVRGAAELGLQEQGYDIWRERPLLTDDMMRRKPEDRYRAGTSELAKRMGKIDLPVVGKTAPEKWERGVDIGSAGLFRQFIPRNLPEGRPDIFYRVPVKFLTKTFMASGYRESEEDVKNRERKRELDLEGGSEAFKLRNDAQSFISPFITRGMGLDNPKDQTAIYEAAKDAYPDYRTDPYSDMMVTAVEEALRPEKRDKDYLPNRPMQRGIRMLEILEPSSNARRKQKMKEWNASGKLTQRVVDLNKGLKEYLPLLRSKE